MKSAKLKAASNEFELFRTQNCHSVPKLFTDLYHPVAKSHQILVYFADHFYQRLLIVLIVHVCVSVHAANCSVLYQSVCA